MKDGAKSCPDRAAIVAAAFAMVEEKGFERLNLRGLARRIGCLPPDVDRHFSKHDLLAAMADTLLAPQQTPLDANATWKDRLRQHANATRRAMRLRPDAALVLAASAKQRRDGHANLAVLVAAGFTPAAAESALELIDRFTLGSALDDLGVSAPDEDRRFGQSIETILHALPRHVDVPQAAAPPLQHRIDHLPLRAVLRIIRESTARINSRLIGLPEFDCRFLALLQDRNDLSSTGIASVLGADKALVSRTLKRLEKIALVERDGIRMPPRLTSQGQALSRRMRQFAELQDRQLLFGLGEAQRRAFATIAEELSSRAAELLTQAIEGRGYGGDLSESLDAAAGSDAASDTSFVFPALLRLSNYVRRGRAIPTKRVGGITTLEFCVLSALAERDSLTWRQVLQAVDRDQSQTWRYLKQLIESGLVERTGSTPRRRGVYLLTVEGRRLHERVDRIWNDYSALLLKALPAPRFEQFAAIMRTIARNAEAQLERERKRALPGGRRMARPPWDMLASSKKSPSALASIPIAA